MHVCPQPPPGALTVAAATCSDTRMDAVTGLESQLIIYADAEEAGTASRLIRAHQAGSLIRVARGAYVPAAVLQDGSQAEREARRYRLTVLAAARRMQAPIFTGHSALALLGLPIVGSWPEDVYVLANRPHGTRRRGVVTVARRSEVPVTAVDGVAITSVEYSLIQVARRASLLPALAAANAACFVPRLGGATPLSTIEALWAEHERLMPYQGSRRVRQTLVRATTKSESVLETISDVAIESAGLAFPIKQAVLTLPSGRTVHLDYLWEIEGIGGEADGDSKYRRGDGAEQVIAEKGREDEMREVLHRLVRWGWQEAWRRTPLATKLLRAGVPRVSRPRTL